MCRSPFGDVAYEFVITSPTVPRLSRSFYNVCEMGGWWPYRHPTKHSFWFIMYLWFKENSFNKTLIIIKFQFLFYIRVRFISNTLIFLRIHFFLLIILSLLCVMVVPLLSFYKDGFSIKLPMKVDIPLNKEAKSNKYSVTYSGCSVSYWYQR